MAKLTERKIMRNHYKNVVEKNVAEIKLYEKIFKKKFFIMIFILINVCNKVARNILFGGLSSRPLGVVIWEDTIRVDLSDSKITIINSARYTRLKHRYSIYVVF